MSSLSLLGGSIRVGPSGGNSDDRGSRAMRTKAVGLHIPARVSPPTARLQSLQWHMTMNGRRTVFSE